MDVVTTFLNGDLPEELYMCQPEGCVMKGKENLVCKLKKSIYGLKQSSWCWNAVFSEYMISLQFQQSTADPCVFVRNSDSIAIVAVYIDNLIVIAETQKGMEKIKQALTLKFKMKDLGKLHFCLGVHITYDEEKGILLMHQKQYITKILEKYQMTEAKTVSTPASIDVKLQKDDGSSKGVDAINYQSMVGSLLYAAVATRPDIAQAVGAVSKFSANPTVAHLTAVKRILRYLKGTINLALRYDGLEDGTLVGYSDADWAGDTDDRHSTSGNLFMMSGGPINWISKKQSVVALSTSEARYIALSSATQEVVWIQKLLSDLKYELSKPTVIMEDNQGTISIAKNPVNHGQTKHIDI